MDQPTPEKKAHMNHWPVVVFLCVAVLAAAAVCIAGIAAFNGGLWP